MTKYNFDPAHNDMRRHVTTGILSTGVLQGVKVLCQFASVVVLARLLPPSDFGVVAMVGPVIGFIGLFQDLGLSQATIQKAKISHDEVNAFFWINVIAGLVLALIVAAISPLVGLYYGDHRVVALTAAMGGLIFLGGFGNQHSAILRRRMKFTSVAALNAITNVSTITVTIVWALIFGGYWSLYAGMVVGGVIPVIGLWIIVKWRPTFPRRVSGLKKMLKFGAGMTTSNFMGFLSGNMDNVLIGHRWGDQALGLYDRAYKLLLFPLQRFVSPLGGIMIPVLSRLMNQPDRYRRAYLNVLEQLTLATWPGILWALILADTLVPTLLGSRWGDAAAIFKYLALAGMLQTITNTTGWLYITQGRSGDLARAAIVTTILSLLAFVIGLPYGAVGVAACYAASLYIRLPFSLWYLVRKGPVRARDFGRALGPQMVSGAAAALALFACRYIMAGRTSPWLLLISGVMVSYVMTVLCMLLFPGGRETLRQTLLFAKRSFLQITEKRQTAISDPDSVGKL